MCLQQTSCPISTSLITSCSSSPTYTQHDLKIPIMRCSISFIRCCPAVMSFSRMGLCSDKLFQDGMYVSEYECLFFLKKKKKRKRFLHWRGLGRFCAVLNKNFLQSFCSPAGKPRDYSVEWCPYENSKWKTRVDIVFAVKAGFSSYVVSTELILKNFWSLHKANYLCFCEHCSTAVLCCSKGRSGVWSEMPSDQSFHLPFGGIHVCFFGQLCPGFSRNHTSNFGCAGAADRV